MKLFKKIPIRIINAILIFLIVAVLMVPIIYAYNTILLRINNSLSESHAREVLVKLDELEISLLNLETGQRGYIITGNSEYLEPYNKALLTIKSTLQELQDIIGDKTQQERLYSLQPLIDTKIEGAGINIELRRDKGLDIAIASVSTEQGKLAMEAIHTSLDKMKTEELILLQARTAGTAQTTSLTLAILFWGGILGLIFYLIINYVIERFVIKGLVEKPIFEREKLLLESVGDGVISIDRSFKIRLFNKVASSLTGFTAEEAIGKPFRDVIKFIKTDTRKDNIVFIEEAMLYGEVKYMESPTSLIRKDGTEIRIGDSASPVFNAVGEVDGCIVVFRDMTKEVEVEKVKDDFTFRIIHDLRSPLTVMNSILGGDDMVNGFASKPELKEGYDLLNDATKQMLGMVNSLLTTTKAITTGSTTKKMAITEIINDTLKTLKPVASTRGIKYEYVPAPNLPTISVSDPEKIKEIFNNLVNNAIKYNKEAGTITITHEIIDNFLKTNVQDTGLGISPENLAKLFVSYSRVNEKEGATGTGLGLYIVKKLVEEAGGKVEVSSQEEIGSIFSVYLPI